MIFDFNLESITALQGADDDWLSLWRIFDSIIEQIDDDLVNQHEVERDEGQIRRQVYLHLAPAEAR